MLVQWFKISCPTTCKLQCFPPHSSNGWALLAKQLAPKHWKISVFSHVLCKIWSCLYLQNIEKHNMFTTFWPYSAGALAKQLAPNTHVEAMAQPFLPHSLSQNTVNYSVFHPCWRNDSSLLAIQLAPKHCNGSVFHPCYSNGPSLLAKRLAPKHCKSHCFYPCCSNGSSLFAKQLAPKHCKLQCFGAM